MLLRTGVDGRMYDKIGGTTIHTFEQQVQCLVHWLVRLNSSKEHNTTTKISWVYHTEDPSTLYTIFNKFITPLAVRKTYRRAISKRMTKIYQVIEQLWNDDGECLQPCRFIVRSTHRTKAEAEKARLFIEKGFWLNTNIHDVCYFFDDKANIKKADTFLRDKFDLSLNNTSILPQTISDKDLIEFLRLTGAKAAWVTSFDTDKKYHVVKFLEVDVYMRQAVVPWEGRPYLDKIVKANDVISLTKQSKWNIRTNLELLKNHETYERDLILNGTFQDLSKRPDELEKVWRKYKQIRFDKKNVRLMVNSSSADAIFDLNEVLHRPLFKIERLTFNEIEEIEANELKLAKRIKKSHPGYAFKNEWLSRLPGIRRY